MRKTITLRIPKELHEAIRKMAKNKGITVNACIAYILWEAVG